MSEEYSSDGEGGQYETPPESASEFDDTDDNNSEFFICNREAMLTTVENERLDELERRERNAQTPPRRSIIQGWREEFKRNQSNLRAQALQNINAVMETNKIRQAIEQNKKNLDAENKQILKSVLQSALAKSLKVSDKHHSVEHEIIKMGEENRLKKMWSNILLCKIFNEVYKPDPDYALGKPKKRDERFYEFFKKLVYDEYSENEIKNTRFLELVQKLSRKTKKYISIQLYAFEFNYNDLYNFFDDNGNRYIKDDDKHFASEDLVRTLLESQCTQKIKSIMDTTNLDPLYRSLKSEQPHKWISDWKKRKSIVLGPRNTELNITEQTKSFQKFIKSHLKKQKNVQIAENDIIATSKDQQRNLFEKYKGNKYFYIGEVSFKSRDDILNEIDKWLIVFVNFHVFITNVTPDPKEDLIAEQVFRLFTSEQTETIFDSFFDDRSSEVYIDIFIEEFLQYKLNYYGGVPLNSSQTDTLSKYFTDILENYDTSKERGLEIETKTYQDLAKIVNKTIYNNLPLFFDEYDNPISTGVKSKNLPGDKGNMEIISSSYAQGTKFRSSVYQQLFGNKVSREVEYWVPKLHMMTGVPVFNEVEKVYKENKNGNRIYLKLNSIEYMNDEGKSSKLYYFRKFIDFYDFLKEWQKTFWNKMTRSLDNKEREFFLNKVNDIQFYFHDELKKLLNGKQYCNELRKVSDQIKCIKLSQYLIKKLK